MSVSRYINPYRLFHGVWIPQWLEKRPEVSEKAKKLYAYLPYERGAWPLFALAQDFRARREHPHGEFLPLLERETIPLLIIVAMAVAEPF